MYTCSLLPCLCWHFATYLGVLPPLADQWKNMKPLARECTASLCVCARDKQNGDPCRFHSTTRGHKLKQQPLTTHQLNKERKQ